MLHRDAIENRVDQIAGGRGALNGARKLHRGESMAPLIDVRSANERGDSSRRRM